MNGNGELTETENVIFYVSYGILTVERNSYVLGYGNGYGSGYVTVETKHDSVAAAMLEVRTVLCRSATS